MTQNAGAMPALVEFKIYDPALNANGYQLKVVEDQLDRLHLGSLLAIFRRLGRQTVFLLGEFYERATRLNEIGVSFRL